MTKARLSSSVVLLLDIDLGHKFSACKAVSLAHQHPCDIEYNNWSYACRSFMAQYLPDAFVLIQLQIMNQWFGHIGLEEIIA